MTDYFCISGKGYEQFIEKLPTELADDFRDLTVPILGCLAWTEADADREFDSEFYGRGIVLEPEEYEQLKEDFRCGEFDCDVAIQRVNEALSGMARDFLSETLEPQS